MDELQQRILGNVMGLNRLELTASFDECGEWGGHDEKFDIYREDKILFVEYIQDIVDCKDPYAENRKIAERKTLQLNETHEKAIVNYLNSLLEIGLKMEYLIMVLKKILKRAQMRIGQKVLKKL